jgi:hypothetical protein
MCLMCSGVEHASLDLSMGQHLRQHESDVLWRLVLRSVRLAES